MTMQKPTGRKCFTLVEMLVVVTILMILAALLIPSLQKALEMSRSVQCVNNLKQVGLAAVIYANDNNSRLPCSLDSANRDWSYTLRVYVAEDGQEMYGNWCTPLYQCPSADNNLYDPAHAYPYHRNYACNNMVFSNAADGPALAIGRVKRPSATAMLMDAPFYGWDYGCWYRIQPGDSTPWLPWSVIEPGQWDDPVPPGEDSKTAGASNALIYRHQGGFTGNAVHVDGSAKSYVYLSFRKNNVYPFQ